VKVADVLDRQVDGAGDRVAADAGDRADRRGQPSWMVERLKRRRWPLVVMLIFVVVAMSYSFWWNPLIHHSQSWVIPGDLWSTFRAAHWVGWGDLGGVYGRDTALVTFPGIAVLLAPVALLSSALGLSESIAPVFLARPTSWLVLGPVMCLLGTTCLFAFDAMAEELGVEKRKRVVLCWMEAAVIFQVVAMWGHPEDLVAMALAVYALLAGFRNRLSLSAWLWGAAIVVQPLVILMVPVALARTPKGQRLRFSVIAAVPSLVLVGTPLIAAWTTTSRVLLHQPNFEFLDHATPWVALSPRLSSTSVGAGPGRLIAVGAALLLGIAATRWRPSPVGVLWLCALALCLRCFFEAVMVSFYLGPPLAMIVLATTLRNDWHRLWAAWTVAMIATVVAWQRLPAWGYWTPMVLLLMAGLILAWPGRESVATRGFGRIRWRSPPGGTYIGPTVCLRPGSISRDVSSAPSASATTARVSPGSMTASTNPRSEACHGVRNRSE
jgi:hypothetical protein